MRYVRFKWAVLGALPLLGIAAEAVARASAVFPPATPPIQESYVAWLMRCLGTVGLLTLVTGAGVFLGACAVVFWARRPAVIASYLVFLLLPLLLGEIAAISAMVSVFGTLARSGAEASGSQILGSLAQVLVTPLSALIITAPSYLVVAIGLFVRTCVAGKRPSNGKDRT
jgi:hypothetical protein